jgi:hypothetical protein
VIVAVISIGMMKVSIHQVVDMVAVRNSLMAAFRSVLMLRVVATKLLSFGAVCGVLCGHLKAMLVDMPVMKVM